MRRLILIAVCTLLALGSLEAKKKNKGRDDRDGYTRFRHEDVRVIDHHYRSQGLPPGLAKRRGDLPPGLAKQLRRNGHLPPGLEKRFEPFPPDLERRLPPLRHGYRRGYLDGRAVVYEERSRTIIDVRIITGR